MTTPKIGDHVRATLGESVIVGVAYSVTDGTVFIKLDRSTERDYTMACRVNTFWSFEILASPIPDVEGFVCKDRHGDTWDFGYGMCEMLSWRSTASGSTYSSSVILAAARGPLVEIGPLTAVAKND